MSRLLERLINIVVCLVFILNLGTVYFTMHYDQFAMISVALFLAALVIILLHYRIAITGKQTVFFIFYALFFIPYAIWSKAGSGILLFCAMIPLSMLLYTYYSKYGKTRELINTFINCVLIIGLVSTFFWLTGSLFHLLSPTGRVLLMWSGKKTYVSTYYNIYYEPQRNHLNIFGFMLNMKNCGIFSEAPMASCVYSTALLLNAYLSREKRFKEFVLMFYILTTQSTTGVIIVITYLVSILYKKKMHHVLSYLFKILIACVITVISIFVAWKLVQMKLATGSGDVRSNKFIEEFNAFLLSPLWGNGFNKYMNGSSNSITSILADGGIILFGFYYFPVIAIMIRYRQNKHFFFILLLYLMMVSITCVITTYFMTGFTVTLWMNLFNKYNNRAVQCVPVINNLEKTGR